MSKMEAIRIALQELGNHAMPVKIQEFVNERFGIEMSTAHVSNYKTAILRQSEKDKKISSVTGEPAMAMKKKKKVVLPTVERVKALKKYLTEEEHNLDNLRRFLDLFDDLRELIEAIDVYEVFQVK